jgi:hypothetical protein
VPPPGDIVQLVKDTATAVVDKVTTVAGQPGKKPASGPDHQPATTPAVHLLRRPAHPSVTVAKPALPSWSLRSAAMLSDVVPTLPTGWAAPSARTPVVAAGASAGAPATHVQTAAEAANDPAGRGSDVMRGVLIALAAAAAATIGASHVTVARSR